MRPAAVLAAAAAVQWGPAATSVAPLRRRLLPTLSGISDRLHVALTYDDGPDTSSTPAFLDLLDVHRRSATFFLLGEHVEGNSSLVVEMVERGHELAVHGWDHRCLAVRRPGPLAGELRRTADLLESLTGRRPRWYRPPYGVQTAEALTAARSAGLRTVLWSAWGRDWSARATPSSVHRTVTAALRPGGTVLLHDTDRTSAPGSWRTTLAASELLLDDWARRGLDVGPLREHW